MEEKTVLEWFEQAKAEGYEWADKAIYNAHNAPTSEGPDKDICYKDQIKISLSHALSAFWWKKTNEGFGFWDKIYEEIKAKES